VYGAIIDLLQILLLRHVVETS